MPHPLRPIRSVSLTVMQEFPVSDGVDVLIGGEAGGGDPHPVAHAP